jgi:hypothetical protein
LEPAKDLRVLGELQQLGNSFVHGVQLTQLKYPRDPHFAVHFAYPPFVRLNLLRKQPCVTSELTTFKSERSDIEPHNPFGINAEALG